MMQYIEVSGKNEEEAIASALAQLGLDRDDVSVEIIERSKSGFLGLGASPAVVRVNYEVPDEPAAGKCGSRAEEFLGGLLEHMGVEAEMQVTEREGGGLNICLSGKNMGAIIGRRGETLDAIQHLTNYAVNHGREEHMHISVDAENYRSKREESLVHLAEKMAAKVVRYRRSMALEPMNSYERHIVHTALQGYEGVTTSSTGTEPNRRVVVTYVRPETPASNKPQSREWS